MTLSSMSPRSAAAAVAARRTKILATVYIAHAETLAAGRRGSRGNGGWTRLYESKKGGGGLIKNKTGTLLTKRRQLTPVTFAA